MNTPDLDNPACGHGLLACLHTWQELVAAIIAALLGGLFVLYQVRRGGADARRQHAARYRALRAALVFPLDELTTYAEACAKSLTEMYKGAHTVLLPGLIGSPPTLPATPTDAVAALTSFVEVAPETAIVSVAAVLSSLQVQRSRIAGVFHRTSGGALRPSTFLEIEGYLIDTAKLHARVQALFPFARFKTDTAPPAIAWSDVTASLRTLGVDADEFPRLQKAVDRYSKEGKLP